MVVGHFDLLQNKMPNHHLLELYYSQEKVHLQKMVVGHFVLEEINVFVPKEDIKDWTE
jgi:hypothetical protein